MNQYIVQKDDTLRGIAAMHLGTTTRWDEIAKLNRLQNPDRIFEGQTLLIPEARRTFFSEPEKVESSQKYIVRYGDTLWKISEKFLGDPNRWGEIARLNQIQDPDHLFVTQPLLLPTHVNLHSERALKEEQQPVKPQHERVRYNQRPTTTIPARGFFFIVGDELNPFSKKLVRKVAFPEHLRDNLELLKQIMHPEQYGFIPKDVHSNVSVGRHVLGMTNSNYISASEKLLGSPRFPGKRYYIDVNKIKGQLISAQEIATDVSRVLAKTKDAEKITYINDILYKSQVIDKEVLIKGPIKPSAIKGAASMGMTRGLQFVQGIGIVVSVCDFTSAGMKSYDQGSINPIAAQSIRQVGGWGAAVVGAKLGTATGALFGISTGPGAVITAGIGGIVGGVAGFFGADWLATYLYPEEAI